MRPTLLTNKLMKVQNRNQLSERKQLLGGSPSGVLKASNCWNMMEPPSCSQTKAAKKNRKLICWGNKKKERIFLMIWVHVFPKIHKLFALIDTSESESVAVLQVYVLRASLFWWYRLSACSSLWRDWWLCGCDVSASLRAFTPPLWARVWTSVQ